MNGRTHEAIGITSVMTAFHASSNQELILASLVALSASTIPDVDLIDNRKGAGLQMLVEVVKQSMLPIGFAIYYDAELYLIAVWLIAMAILVAQPHRGLSHSVWSSAWLSMLFCAMTNKTLARAFCIAYASHLIIDITNTKTVQILYPKGFCLGLFKSGGFADWMIGALASAFIVVMIAARMIGFDIVGILLKGVIR